MHADNWAIKAKQDGYRTRAVYKLDEIVQKTKVLKKAKHILDLGSAPGGWAHYIKQKSKVSGSGLGRYLDRFNAANLVPDATIWLCSLLPQGRGATTGSHPADLPRHRSICAVAALRLGPGHTVS